MVAVVLSIFALATTCSGLVVSRDCPVQFEGRVPAGSTLTSFDVNTSLYNPGYVKGGNLTWSQIIRLPGFPVLPSLFDLKEGTKALEVTISDASIFAPSSTYSQPGFRRAELLPASNTGLDNSTIGVKTLHFSLLQDSKRPLNASHEYQLAFLETNDYSTNQFALKYGTIIGGKKGADPELLVLQSNVRDPRTLFQVKFKKNVWQNFGLVLDFEKNTTQVLYSENYFPLQKVTKSVPNDLSGQGQFHFGILKKPTGENITDLTQQGYQPKGINEGVIFGGIFEEDSEKGCISYLP